MKALDLFAGTGWGVACKRLGIHEEGVEIMSEAVATREANGMATIYRDVWEGLDDAPREYDLLIASPPCQTFSMAGKGAGRRALDDVIRAIDGEAYKDPAALRAFGQAHDPRTALVLTPLAHVWRDRPRFVAMEQVPSVRPVWEACAQVMRGWGYDVKVDVLLTEQYGVPQTRKRAILVARLDGEAMLPTPTHSRYYSQEPERLDDGVLPWVGVSDVLDYDVPGATFTANNKLMNQARRPLKHPAPTITAGHDSGNRGILAPNGTLTVATVADVAAIQSYPADFAWRGARTKQLLQIGNAVPPLLAEAILRALTA